MLARASRARRSGVLEIGPLSLNAYGLMIALGVVAAVWLFGRRLEGAHIGTRDDANAIGVWGVVAGVIGARLYHVLTDWHRFEGNWFDVSRSGRAASASPAGCSPASSSACTWATGGAGSRSAPASTPWPRRCRSPRRSVAGATTSTRSSTDVRPTCRGRSRSTTSTCRRRRSTRRARRSTRRSSTSRSWNLGLVGLILWLDKRYTWAGGQLLAIYVHGLRRRALLDREPADRRGRPPRRSALEPVGRPRARSSPAPCTCSSREVTAQRVYEAPPSTPTDDTAAIAMATADLGPTGRRRCRRRPRTRPPTPATDDDLDEAAGDERIDGAAEAAEADAGVEPSTPTARRRADDGRRALIRRGRRWPRRRRARGRRAGRG